MKKCVSAFLAGVSLFIAAEASARNTMRNNTADLLFSAGYRQDELDWNIADTDGTPNVLSELNWTDLEIFQLKAGVRAPLDNNFYFRGMGDYGWIYDGENQDSDYIGNDRTGEISRSNNKADDGDVWDLSAGLGIRNVFMARPFGTTLDIMPVAGYSYHRQDLVIREGFQTIPATGPFAGLDSSYESRWHGPWAGVDVIYEFYRFTLLGTFEYHWADYHAEADWNLRTDFAHPKSFEHDGDGDGMVMSVGLDYKFSDMLSLNATYEAQDWEIRDGTDRTFFAAGTSSETRLNEVNWNSYAAMIGLRYIF